MVPEVMAGAATSRHRPKPLATENELLDSLIRCVPFAIPYVRIFRRQILNVQAAGGWWARAGIKGQADAYAYVRGGRVIELETKAARGEMRERQIAWREFCLDFGIPHLVLRAGNGEPPTETVARWVEEVRGAADS